MTTNNIMHKRLGNLFFILLTIIVIYSLFYLYNESKEHPEHFVYECNPHEFGIYYECPPPSEKYLFYQKLLTWGNWLFVLLLLGLIFKYRKQIKKFLKKLDEVENG